MGFSRGPPSSTRLNLTFGSRRHMCAPTGRPQEYHVSRDRAQQLIHYMRSLGCSMKRLEADRYNGQRQSTCLQDAWAPIVAALSDLPMWVPFATQTLRILVSIRLVVVSIVPLRSSDTSWVTTLVECTIHLVASWAAMIQVGRQMVLFSSTRTRG